MNIGFIADYFSDEVPGGGELNNEELIGILSKENNVLKIKSLDCGDEAFEHFATAEYDHFIVSNFISLSEKSKLKLQENYKYIIYEHDHKYILNRNPGQYNDYLAPKDQIVNFDFYKNATAVVCQSTFHKEIVEKNLGLKNIVSVGGNLWSEETLELLESMSTKEKSLRFSIMHSPILHKNTTDAIRFCEVKNLSYELIPPLPYTDFLRRLGTNTGLVFFPKTPETLSRIVCEARMMGMKTITNKRLGAAQEDWFKFKGTELINIMREKRKEIPLTVMELLSG